MKQAVPHRLQVAAGVVPGLSAMLGAGLLTGLAPAAGAAGRWLLAGIVIGFSIALCSGFSTGDQSRRYAGVGGGYLYTRHQLGVLPGRMAGSAALVGRICAGAAVAGTFGVYVLPEHPVYAAIGVSLAATALDAVGFRPPRGLVIGVVVTVVLTLTLYVAVCFSIAPPDPVPLPADVAGSDNVGGLLPAAGLMFFGFLGFEHVTSSTDRTYSVRQMHIAVPVLMIVTLVAGLAVAGATLHQLGGPRMAVSPAPLRDALAAADGQFFQPLISGVAGIATMFGLLLAVASIRRTLSAMAEFSDVPPSLSIVGPRGVSAPAAVLSGVAIAAAAALLNPPQAIGVAACLLLFYYAFTNASARLLTPADRTWPRRAACFGLGLSVLVGMNMSVKYLVVVVLVMTAGCVSGAIISRYARK
ncbi:APA family basic amino acid/polyamine antiporter [Kibdelosporangium banguiense]|uniref:APA family basic amino acid/polyamine antiporter n=1 Tax=Kibdelosporangium banguiense TaxID=1365924 RepID=A0ABS4U3C3_9PSEU|nr:APC family permease [Kibdelosporangium banguiense]MBP2331170.1 APA family basic amino acid/polyamine antiporter [Kibdelosporangium banguiense]